MVWTYYLNIYVLGVSSISMPNSVSGKGYYVEIKFKMVFVDLGTISME